MAQTNQALESSAPHPAGAYGGESPAGPDRLARGRQGKLYVAAPQEDMSAGMLSYNKVQVPSIMEVERWVQELRGVPKEGSVDVSNVVDYTLRFEMLSYLRNSGQEAQSLVLKCQASNSNELIEFQFHGTDNYDCGAHAVVYLYKLPTGGIGVVLSFKGTTANSSDWGSNLKIWRAKDDDLERITKGTPLFTQHAHGLASEARVHPGYFEYYQSIVKCMKRFSIAHLQPLLDQWQTSSSGVAKTDLWSWLHSGANWQWCALVGQSMGGALASYAATDIALISGKPTLLSTSGTPGCGNIEFLQLQNELLQPHGGLRIHNHGDIVTMTGYSGLALRWSSKCHAGRSVVLTPKMRYRVDPYHLHQRYQVTSDIFGTRLLVTYKFPGFTYDPSAEHSESSRLSTHFMGRTWTSSEDFPVTATKHHQSHRSALPAEKKTLPPLILQWFDDETGTWRLYTDNEERQLRKAFAAEKPGLQLMIDGHDTYCDLVEMVQRTLGDDSELHEVEMRVVFEDELQP